MKAYERILRRGDLFPAEAFYVLGALLGDGCAYRRKRRNGYRLILVGDERFCRKYAEKLSFCIGRDVKAYPDRSKGVWFVSARNDEMCSAFHRCRQRPERVLELIGPCNRSGSAAFVEGFFDAEGCVKLVKEKARKTAKVCLDMTNTHYELLEAVRISLLTLEIASRYSSQEAHIGSDGHPRKKPYHLRVYKKEEIKKFFDLVETTKLTEEKAPHVRTWLGVKSSHPFART